MEKLEIKHRYSNVHDNLPPHLWPSYYVNIRYLYEKQQKIEKLLIEHEEKIEKIEKKNKKLEKENEKLRTILEYIPGGIGYQMAQEHFNDLLDNDKKK